MKRMILFGGSFNPVHIGHLWMAQAAREVLSAQTVVFMPTGDSPHKKVHTAAAHRARMVQLACAPVPGFVFSGLEVQKEGPSYTIQTVKHLLKEDPERKITLLIGEDSLLQFHTWKSYEELLSLVTLAVVPRFHAIDADTGVQMQRLFDRGAKIHGIPMPRIELSSTQIRKRARLGRTLSHLVPRDVANYIEEQKLYRDERTDAVLERLQRTLSLARYQHSLRVAETAERLAEIHGVDPEQALVAGLLHDSAKGREEELLSDETVRDNFNEEKEARSLWHTYLGPGVAAGEYGVDDQAVLDAIRRHTTADLEMTRLDKILYIADKTEPGRSDPENPGLLRLAERDLDEAFFRVMEASVHYLKANGLQVHPVTNKIYQNLSKER